MKMAEIRGSINGERQAGYGSIARKAHYPAPGTALHWRLQPPVAQRVRTVAGVSSRAAPSNLGGHDGPVGEGHRFSVSR
jgi:hypothetical protein